MLGNFSFGDYFKEDAIRFAWELFTKVYGLEVERLWFTVFEGDGNVPADEEAAALWVKAGASPDRVLRFGKKDNFWSMGDTGAGLERLASVLQKTQTNYDTDLFKPIMTKIAAIGGHGYTHKMEDELD